VIWRGVIVAYVGIGLWACFKAQLVFRRYEPLPLPRSLTRRVMFECFFLWPTLVFRGLRLMWRDRDE
jgi:hypothetical protein